MRKKRNAHCFGVGLASQRMNQIESVEKKAAPSTLTPCRVIQAMPPVFPVASVPAVLDSVYGVGIVLRVAPVSRGQIPVQSL